MMQKLMLIAIVAIGCFVSPVMLAAQDNGLHVIQPSDVLIDSSLHVEKQPVLRIDDDQRVVQYFDPKTERWKEIAYPTEVEAIKSVYYYVELRTDGTYLYNPDGFWGFSRERAESAWIIDPKLGGFRRPDEACGLVQSLPNEGWWRIVESEAQSYAFLCFTETGSYSPAIPEKEPATCYDSFRREATVSPDRKWVIFFCSGGSESGLSFVAYSYQVDTQQFRYLGGNPSGYDSFNENIDVIRWINTTTAVIHTYPSWNPPTNSYYVVDVSKENDLQFVAWDLYAAPHYVDEPPHIEWMPCEYMGCIPSEEYNEHGNLYAGEHGLRVFDFTTRRWTIYPDLPRIWGVSEVIPDGSGDRLYRTVNNGDGRFGGTSASLIHFNYDTQKTVPLYTGDIEWINSFSSDGRYVVLEMGSDNTVASSLRLADPQSDYHPDGNSHKGVFDLKANKFVFQAEGKAWEWLGDDPMPFQWIDHRTFLIQDVADTGDLIVHLTEQGYAVDKVTLAKHGWNVISPDHRHLLVYDQGALAVYEIETRRTTPIVRTSTLVAYSIGVSWDSETRLRLSISANPKGDNEAAPRLANWLVTIPQ